MIAALGPPKEVPWVAALEAGPDDRSIREQLVEHGKVVSAYFRTYRRGWPCCMPPASRARNFRARKGEPPPAQAFRALTAWLRRAQGRGRLANCDVETLATTILGCAPQLGVLARVSGQSMAPAAGKRHVERFIDLLWNGIGGGKP